MANEFTVMAVEAVIGGPTTFVLAQNSPARWVLASNSFVVQGVMLASLLTGGKIAPETIDDTKVIRRVPPFDKGGRSLLGPGEYRVDRVATQRSDGVDHLEVFILHNGRPTIPAAYNVYDQFLQQLLLAAFLAADRPTDDVPLTVGFEGDQLVSVRLGRP